MATKGYLEFLRSIFSHNIVIFYGINIDDVSVSGQIEYFKEIGFISGDYFLVKKEPEPNDLKLSEILPIQFIYTGKNFTWELGFSRFIDELSGFNPNEPLYAPVSANAPPSVKIPPPDELLRSDPDNIRKTLSSSAKHFFNDNEFDFTSYKKFCSQYDSAIHLSTRVSTSPPNNKWLDNIIYSELGKGNFGRVYAANSPAGHPIAIKVAHADVRDDETMLNSFRRGVASMKILSDSKIDGIVKLLDASEMPPSIIMEYVNGIDLEKYILTSGRLDSITKLRICKWISEIIFQCHSHEKVILHRDLRPSNVMISGEYWNGVEKNNISILDFDLSWFKGASGSEFYMNAAQALGFLAPEQLNLHSKHNTKSALVDVYGIGMLLYFILSEDIPLANASTRIDWPERLESASRKLFNKDWKSNINRGYRLMAMLTNEDQELRPSLQYAMAELDTLIGTFVSAYPFDEDSVIEELSCRLAGYDVKASSQFGLQTRGFVSGGGVRVEFTALRGEIACEIDYVINESTNRTGRGKYLESALQRAIDAISRVAEVDKKKSATSLGGNKLKFMITAPKSIKEINEISEKISTAIQEISLKS